MVDIKLTLDGDLEIGPDGDLATVYGDEQIAQEALFRLKTTRGDYVLSPDVGASLEDFIGEPNTPFVRTAIEQRIYNTLTSKGLIIDPTIDVIPIGLNDVYVLIEFPSVEALDRIIQLEASLDLKKGLVFARSGSRVE